MSEDRFGCQTWGREGGCYWSSAGRARATVKHPTMHRAAKTKNFLTPNINSAKVEKPYSTDSTDLEIIWIPTISKHSM